MSHSDLNLLVLREPTEYLAICGLSPSGNALVNEVIANVLEVAGTSRVFRDGRLIAVRGSALAIGRESPGFGTTSGNTLTHFRTI